MRIANESQSFTSVLRDMHAFDRETLGLGPVDRPPGLDLPGDCCRIHRATSNFQFRGTDVLKP